VLGGQAVVDRERDLRYCLMPVSTFYKRGNVETVSGGESLNTRRLAAEADLDNPVYQCKCFSEKRFSSQLEQYHRRKTKTNPKFLLD
jgi:hypothetical protein